ncbi:DNA topoisomerase IB [Streptomyces sp. URMC 127]|uniref:DNA topoisomerase IB n=1 Tax=Streptomyces sp. URMC 127 TaxID=3423402 RepID=UPI003F1C4245
MRLRTSDPNRPGHRRVRRGRGFAYLDRHGDPLPAAEAERIRGLAIPPAWREVWICPWLNGHLQAVGTDAAGRRQYLYHPAFRAQQEAAKHEHVLRVAECLPAVRRTAGRHLGERGLAHDRVLSCAVRLLDLGLFRVGSDAYAQEHGTYGLTTMLSEHLTCRRGEVTFAYPAKGGQHRVQAVADPDVCRTLASLHRHRRPEQRLFAYRRRGGWCEVDSDELNAWLRELAGLDVTAKDFRTWHATVLAAVALAVSEPVARAPEAARRRAVVRAVKEVAVYLGNTPAVCRSSYINPRVFELYEDGVTVAPALGELGRGVPWGAPATQGAVEEAVLRMLAQ